VVHSIDTGFGLRLYLTYVFFMVSIGLLDAVTIYKASSQLGADPMYLGILSFLWSLFYIISTMAFGPLGDNYKIRALAIIASSLMISSMLSILFSDSLSIIAVGYILHAIASSAGHIAISIDVMENKDPDEWGYINYILKGLYWIFRGVFIYFSLTAGYQDLLVMALILIASIHLLVIPQGFFRRAIYRAELMLEKIYGSMVLRGLTITSILERKPGSLHTIEAMWGWFRSNGNPLFTAMSASMLAMAFELVVTPSPPILVREMGSQGLAMYLYTSPILVGFSMLIITPLLRDPVRVFMGRISLAISILSGLALAISYRDGSHGIPLAFPLITFSLSYQLSELDAYYKYSSITAGYDMGRYLAIREIGGLVGGLLSGYIATVYGYMVSIIAGMILIVISQIVRML
jgi:MFS family permease